MTTTFPAFSDTGFRMLLHLAPQVFSQTEMKSSTHRQAQVRVCPSWHQPLFLRTFESFLDSRFVLAHRWFCCEFIEPPDTNEIFLNLNKSWNWSESSGGSFCEKLAFFFFPSVIGTVLHVTLITPLGEQKTKTLPAKLIPFWDFDLSDICFCKLHHSSILDQKD